MRAHKCWETLILGRDCQASHHPAHSFPPGLWAALQRLSIPGPIPAMMATQSAAAVLIILFIVGVMEGSTVVESAISENYGSHHQVFGRRLLKASATPSSAFNSTSVCGGLGPVCPDGVRIECRVGGIVGCICALVRTCQPTVSGCTLFNGASVTPCGF